ncbi:hypothetical protein GOBAR_DD06052 [Gossypium barbadense]|nr:hypothetical protein GOBAR_DD06052 [Gossypium barbadense]
MDHGTNSEQLDLESQLEPRVILPLQPKTTPRGQTLLIVNGNWCNPTHPNFDFTMPIILKIVEYCDSIVPVSYRRYGAMLEKRRDKVHIQWISVLQLGVDLQHASAGDIVKVSVKGSRTGWMSMNKN